jgi:cytochrome P450
VSRAFTPRRIGALEAHVRDVCADLLDRHVGGSGFDFVESFAAQLPSRVISTLVGVPPEDQEQQRANVDGMFHIEPGVGMANQKAIECAFALLAYLGELAQERARAPRDDLISALASARLAGADGSSDCLTPEECTSFAVLLYSAGTETVSKLLGNAAVILARHPDQRAQLVSHPELIPNAIEELLRYEPPSPVNGRWTTSPVELHGATIPEGAKVLLLTGSAGRDEEVFPDPDRFDIARPIAHHLSFGYGPHFCVGAALARLESRIALEETLIRFPEWEVDTGQLQRAHTSTVRGYGSVPMRIWRS